MFTKLHIEYANPSDFEDSILLTYQLLDNPVVELWSKKVLTAQQLYPMDDPSRFYGFGSLQEQQQDALDKINRCITLIKLKHPNISTGHVDDVCDQDKLNFWHHIFETYHGLLGKEDPNNNLAPVLADLNICVHRCESVARGAEPRHVVTWFGLPKTDQLSDSDYKYFTDSWRSGTVFLNYVEIGKTIENLAEDHDLYISAGAFQPFRHYSADFVVRFYEQTQEQAQEKRVIINQYYQNNKDFFGPWRPEYAPGNLPVAEIIGSIPFEDLKTRQYVKSVTFT